jgi:hypothetical protein
MRVEILLRFWPDLAGTIQFSPQSTYPMLDNTVAMQAVMERERMHPGRLLFDDSDSVETELERCKGAWCMAMSSIDGAADHLPDVETAASMLKKHVLPLWRAAKTR